LNSCTAHPGVCLIPLVTSCPYIDGGLVSDYFFKFPVTLISANQNQIIFFFSCKEKDPAMFIPIYS
jgi:hypothetical protein